MFEDFEDETTTKKVKKLKLLPNQVILVNHIDIQVKEFTVADDDGEPCIDYGALLLLWIDRGDKACFPITMHIPVAGEHLKDVVAEAYKVASGMCDSVDAYFELTTLCGSVITTPLEEMLDSAACCGNCDSCDCDE